jgi:hypothetical protein
MSFEGFLILITLVAMVSPFYWLWRSSRKRTVANLRRKLERDSVEMDAEAKRVLYSNINRLTRR